MSKINCDPLCTVYGSFIGANVEEPRENDPKDKQYKIVVSFTPRALVGQSVFEPEFVSNLGTVFKFKVEKETWTKLKPLLQGAANDPTKIFEIQCAPVPYSIGNLFGISWRFHTLNPVAA